MEMKEAMERIEEKVKEGRPLKIIYLEFGQVKHFTGRVKNIRPYRCLDFGDRVIAFLGVHQGIKTIFCDGQRIYENPLLHPASALDNEIQIRRTRRILFGEWS